MHLPACFDCHHLQVLHESGKASDAQLSLGSLLGVVAPLLQQFILEGKAGEDSGHEIKQVDRDREANVTDAAIQTLGALAAQLPWVQYEQLLNQWMKAMKKKGGKVSILSTCLSQHMPAKAMLESQKDKWRNRSHCARNAPHCCVPARPSLCVSSILCCHAF